MLKTSKKLYIVQVGGDVVGYAYLPLIHVFRVNTGADSAAPSAPANVRTR